MPSLIIKHQEELKKIYYSEQLAKGIYLVEDNKQAIKNCKTFNIQFEPYDTSDHIQTPINKFKDFSFLTLKGRFNYLQYVIFYSSLKRDLKECIKGCPKKLAILLKFASERPADLMIADMV
jgi:hypothetical protein